MKRQNTRKDGGEILKSLEHLTDPQLKAVLTTTARGFGIWRQGEMADQGLAVSQAAADIRARIEEYSRPAMS